MALTSFIEEILEAARRIESGGQHPDLARIVKKLTELEVEEGGPYALSPGGKADIGLNLAVERFLRACDVHLPKLDAYLAAAIRARKHSAALSVERVAELIAERGRRSGKSSKQHLDAEEERIMTLIRRAAEKRFQDLPDFMRGSAKGAIEKTIRGNVDRQMSLMPLYMRQALGSKGVQYSDEYIADLGLANIFFWTAFIIYDDFWDEDEAAEPRILPIANLFARHYIDAFSHLVPGDSFSRLFHTMMDKLDAANAWETARCRARVEDGVFIIPKELPEYGDFGIKFYPAAGHVFGPLALLVGNGYKVDSAEVSNMVDYFRHYLVAMQLNDDMHDWKEDFARGHISTAVSVLIAKWLEKYPSRKSIGMESDMPELERLFWFESLKPLSESALEHAKRSRAALQKISSIENPEPLEKYIRRNEDAVHEALSHYATSRDLLRVFAA